MNDENNLLPNLPLPGYISVKEAARILGLAEKTVYRYVEEGKLPAIRISSSPFVMVEEEATRNYKRQSVGRPRTRIPTWRLPAGANLLFLTQIIVPLRPGQHDRFDKKLKEIHADEKHLLPGTVARYIARSEAKPDDIQIVLVWRSTVMPPAAEREAALAALREELAEIVDWDSSWSEYGRVLMHT